MTLIVESELCMCRTHGSSFLPSWVPATELRLSVFTHSASTPAPQDGVSMHAYFVLCSYPCFSCYFLLSVPPPPARPLLLHRVSKSENAIECCTPYGRVRVHCTHLHSISSLTRRLTPNLTTMNSGTINRCVSRPPAVR